MAHTALSHHDLSRSIGCMAAPRVDKTGWALAPSWFPTHGRVTPLVVATAPAVRRVVRSSDEPGYQLTKEAHPDGAA